MLKEHSIKITRTNNTDIYVEIDMRSYAPLERLKVSIVMFLFKENG